MEYRDGLGRGWRVGTKALERMIDESSGDAHRWLDVLLDLQDARTTLDATRAKLAECEQKAESYDLTHTGDWFERAHALGQRDPAKYAGRDIWHVAVEMAESLAEVERERDEALGCLHARLPGISELDEKIADHRDWLRRQRQMRVAIAPVAVEAVGDMLREMTNLCAAGLEVERALAASQAREARLREAGSALAHWATPLGSIDAMIQAEQLRLARVQWAALASAPGSTDALRRVLAQAVECGASHSAPNDDWLPSQEEVSAIVSCILVERAKEGGDE